MKRPSIVPLFAVRGGSAQLVEPPSGVREYGFATGTKPPAQWVNFQLHGLGNWVERLRSPNRANYSRTSHAERLIAVAADTLSSDSTLAQPIRKLVAIDDRAAGYVHVSVRGDDWVQLTMQPAASIGGAVCVCLSSTAGWYVGGNSSTPGDGAICYADSSFYGASPIANDTNNWTICSVPVGTKPVRAIASNTATGGVIAVTTHAVLYSSGSPTTFVDATLSTAFAGPGTDVCTTSTAYLAVTATGQVFRATVLASTWTLVTTLSAKTWRLAADDTGVVVAYPQGSTAGDTWYVSTDHGLTWAAHTAPAHVSEIQRIRFVDGSWVLTSAEFPYLAESNDLSSTSWSRLPVPIQVTGSQHELCDVAVVDEGLVTVGDSHWLLGQRGELVAPGPWAPVSSVLPLADAGYLQGRAIDPAAPSAGQVLAWDAGSSRWKPAAPGGGGSLPAGTNGGVLAHAAGTWASTAAGSAGQLLLSNGASAPSWGQTTLPLTQRVTDATNNAPSVCATFEHLLSAGIGANGVGARCVFSAPNDTGTPVDAAAIDGILIDVADTAEVGAVDVRVRGGGGSLVPTLRVQMDTLLVRPAAAWVALAGVAGGEWVYGSDDAANGGSAVLLAPSSGAGLYLRRGATNHLAINSAGAMTAGNSSFQTTLAGARIVLQGPIAVHDASASSVVTAATIAHTLSSGSASAGIGARATLAAHNAAGTLTDAIALDGILTNTGAGTEAGALAISTRTGGGALTERLRVHGAGGLTVGTTLSLTSGVGLANNTAISGANSANSGWFSLLSVNTGGVVLIGDASNTGVIMTTGATSVFQISTAGVNGLTYRGYLTAASGIERQMLLSEPIAQTGTAGWTLLELSPTLTTQGSGTKRAISYSVAGSERLGVDENGCFVGLRLRRTAVNNTAHTVAALSCYVDMIGLTAARTVTGPSSPVQAGTVVVITNGDGSADGTKTITFAPASGTVNGAATHVAINAAYGSCTYVCDGTNWTVIAKV